MIMQLKFCPKKAVFLDVKGIWCEGLKMLQLEQETLPITEETLSFESLFQLLTICLILNQLG